MKKINDLRLVKYKKAVDFLHSSSDFEFSFFEAESLFACASCKVALGDYVESKRILQTLDDKYAQWSTGIAKRTEALRIEVDKGRDKK